MELGTWNFDRHPANLAGRLAGIGALRDVNPAERGLPLRIAYVCQYFVPEPAAPAARVHELSRAWVAAGHQVTVLTAFPNHPTGEVPPGYRGKVQSEERVDGIRVLRSWLYARPNRGVGNRGLSQATFMLTVPLLGLPRLGPVDVVIASSPPLFAALGGWLIARVRRVPFVLEVRDLWPDAFAEIGVLHNGIGLRLLYALARFLYRAAARVVVVSDGFADRLRAQGVPARKIEVIPNGADLDLFRSHGEAVGDAMRQALDVPNGGDTFVAAYVGSHGVSQGLDVVLDAAARLPAVTFLLVGDGSEKASLQQRAAREGLANVLFRPSVLKAGVPRLYAAADVCLVPLRNVPIFETFIPSKVFEILACGRPLVAAVAGEPRAIVQAAGGEVVPPGDGAALADAIARLRLDSPRRAEMAGRGRQFVAEHFNRTRLAARYLDILANVVGR